MLSLNLIFPPPPPMVQRIFKPNNFHSKPNEDTGVWLAHFEKIANANEWNNANKLRIVPVFLKDTAEKWFVRQTFTHWTAPDEPNKADILFILIFLDQYNTEAKKSRWNDQFDFLHQGKKKVEEYNKEFFCLWRKVNLQEHYP